MPNILIYFTQFIIIFSFTLGINTTQNISYVDLNGVLHNSSAINGKIDPNIDWASWAYYHNGINETGWAQLEIHSNEKLNDSLQAYFSGLIEGYLTYDLIEMQWNNVLKDYCVNETQYCQKLFAFITTNIEFVKNQIKKYGETDPYWHQIELSFIQLTGIEDGYKQRKNTTKPLGPRFEINSKGLIILNLLTELGELEKALSRKETYFEINDKCSAIIKVGENGSDLFVSHNAWTSYSWMLRIMKKYDLNYQNISAKSISFSSYPGIIFSIDDYYLISSGLAVVETTIGNYNSSLWKYVIADNIVFEFIRNTVANRLARSGKEWTQIFSKLNSGTYNNQFMIVDYNKFQKGVKLSELPNDLLWIIEQMPGLTTSGDVTHILREQSYWPSYNVPYFKSIYDISNITSLYKRYGDFYSYNNTARALIFARDQTKVKDLSTLYKLMRYNDFKNDPLSKCDCIPPYTAKYAIASRGDLNDPNGTYPFRGLGFSSSGALDAKLTNVDLFAKLEMIAVSGPTYDDQPSFQWSTSRIVGVRHSGQPDQFKFPPIHVKWSPNESTVETFNNSLKF